MGCKKSVIKLLKSHHYENHGCGWRNFCRLRVIVQKFVKYLAWNLSFSEYGWTEIVCITREITFVFVSQAISRVIQTISIHLHSLTLFLFVWAYSSDTEKKDVCLDDARTIRSHERIMLIKRGYQELNLLSFRTFFVHYYGPACTAATQHYSLIDTI